MYQTASPQEAIHDCAIDRPENCRPKNFEQKGRRGDFALVTFPRIVCVAFLCALQLAGHAYAGIVSVSDSYTGSRNSSHQVPPNAILPIPLGEWKAGDRLAVRVNTNNNALASDITACVASADEASNYHPPRSSCNGRIRARTPFEIRQEIAADGPLALILDNSYANFITKNVAVTFAFRRTLSAQQTQSIRDFAEAMRARMSDTFTDADFNIHVDSCGQSNAFSNKATADITLCTELVNELANKKNVGALLAIYLHEYGHSLLNKWGEPGSSEEDMADQFASAMLLKGGDKGRALLMQWVSYWQERDSTAEARNQLAQDDPHSLSIQRARNIQRYIIESDEFLRRWNKMLYRHMTSKALKEVIEKPGKGDDRDLAVEALRASGTSQSVINAPLSVGTVSRAQNKFESSTSQCTMSLQCDRGRACRRHQCELLANDSPLSKNLPPLESVSAGGACLGDEHCLPGLVCSPKRAKCEAE